MLPSYYKRCRVEPSNTCTSVMQCSALKTCVSVRVERFSVAIMLDTEGSEVHTSALDQPIKAEVRSPAHCRCHWWLAASYS